MRSAVLGTAVTVVVMILMMVDHRLMVVFFVGYERTALVVQTLTLTATDHVEEVLLFLAAGRWLGWQDGLCGLWSGDGGFVSWCGLTILFWQGRHWSLTFGVRRHFQEIHLFHGYSTNSCSDVFW